MRNPGEPLVLTDTAEYDNDGKPVAVKIRQKDEHGNEAEFRTADEKYLKSVPKKGESSNPLMRGLNSLAGSVGNAAKSVGDVALADPAAPVAAAPAPTIDPTSTPTMSLDAQNAPIAPVPLPTIDPMAGVPTAPVVVPEASPQIPLSANPSGEQGGTPVPATTLVSPTASLTQHYGSGGGVVDLAGTKETQKVYRPEDEGAIKDRLKQLTDAHDAELAAYTEKNKVDIERSKAESTQIKSFMDKEQKKQAEENYQTDIKAKEYQAEVDKMANTKLTDPHMFYGQSTGNQILAGIAVSLGALGQALGQPGTENAGIKAIRASLDRDIATQKYNMDNQKDIANSKRTLYQDLVKKYGDERAARSAYQGLVMQQVAKEFEARGLATNDATMKAKTDAANAQANMEAQQKFAEMHTILKERTTDQKPATTSGRDTKPQYVESGEHDKLQARREFVKDLRDAEKLYRDPKYTKYMGLLNSKIEDVKEKFGGKLPPEYLELRERSMALQNHLQMVTTGMGVSAAELDKLQKQIGQVFEDPNNAANKFKALNTIHTERAIDYGRGLNTKYLQHPDVFNYTKGMTGDLEEAPKPMGTPK